MSLTESVSFRLFIFYILTYFVCGLPLVPRYDKYECTQQIAVAIAEQFYSNNQPTITWSKNTTDNDSLQMFRHFYSGCLLSVEIYGHSKFSSSLYSRNIPYHVTQYVIHIERVKDFEYFLSQMKSESFFANYGKFIIICHNTSWVADGCDAELLFSICWKHYLANVIFLYHAPAGEVTVSTYFPMADGRCDNTTPKIFAVGTCTKYNFVQNLFPQKFYNFNGCPLIMSRILLPPYVVWETNANGKQTVQGLEGDLNNILCKMINATLETQLGIPPSTFNGTHWTGIYNALMMRRANLSDLRFLDFDATRAFRIVYPSLVMQVGWMSPPLPLQPAWEKLIRPFNIRLRISFAVVITTLIVTLVILKETRLKRKWNAYFTMDTLNSNLYINACAIFAGQITARRPRSASLTCCLALWIWFSFFMLSAYQGALVGILKQDVYQTDLNTVSGAIKAGYDFGGQIELRNYFANEPKLFEMYKVINTENINEYLGPLCRGSLKFIIRGMLDFMPCFRFVKNHSLHIIPNDIQHQHLYHYLIPDSPLVDTLSTMYARLAASGILERMTSGIRQRTRMENLKGPSNSESNTLTMHHMHPCFLLAAGGWSLSLLIFSIEIIWKRFVRSQNSKCRSTIGK